MSRTWTIADTAGKCKKALSSIPRDALILLVLLLSSSLSFGFGYLAGLDEGEGSDLSPLPAAPFASSTESWVVASKSGMKYYFPWCSGAERISDENRAWFPSTTTAEAAGYTPAAHCDGR